MTVSRWLADAERRLLAAGVKSARIEAQLLAAHTLLVDRGWVLAHPSLPFPDLAGEALLQRREAREPLAYILGWREFYGRRFAVRPGVLIPRQETECLVEVALQEGTRGEGPGTGETATPHTPHTTVGSGEVVAGGIVPASARCGRRPHTPYPIPHTLDPKKAPLPSAARRVLDLGTGSGILALTLKLERPDWDVTAVDISSDALDVARQNARDLGADVRFILSDGFEALSGERFDLIVTNPPYVALSAPLDSEIACFEPSVALFSGETGLEFYRMLASDAPARLAEGGLVISEVGDGTADQVAALFRDAGWTVLRRAWTC